MSTATEWLDAVQCTASAKFRGYNIRCQGIEGHVGPHSNLNADAAWGADPSPPVQPALEPEHYATAMAGGRGWLYYTCRCGQILTDSHGAAKHFGKALL